MNLQKKNKFIMQPGFINRGLMNQRQSSTAVALEKEMEAESPDVVGSHAALLVRVFCFALPSLSTQPAVAAHDPALQVFPLRHLSMFFALSFEAFSTAV